MPPTHPTPYTTIRPGGGTTGAPLNMRKRLALIARAIDLNGKSIIDCGCGTGEYVHALRGLGHEAWGIEYTLATLRRTARRAPPPDHLFVSDIEHAALPAAQFDVALLNEVLEHIPNDAQGLHEIYRLLKPGGSLVIFAPNRRYPFETHGVWLKRPRRRLPHSIPFIPYIPLGLGRYVFDYWARNYWPHELRALVEQAGFRVERVGYVWQTLENISGRQPAPLRLLRPLLRHLFGILEHLPLLRTLGVSQVIIARKPALSVAPAAASAAPGVHLLGVRIDSVSLAQLLQRIGQQVQQRQHAIVANVNVHAMNLAYSQPWFRAFLNQSDLVFCDGFGVKWGARLLGEHIPERITYADWTWDLAAFAAHSGYTLFLLGARPEVIEAAAARLRQRFPALRIVGTQHGYFDKTPGSSENQAVIQAINAAQPDILLVGFGMPLQERWLQENWPHIQAHVALTGGAVFDYISGSTRRGPRWMTNNGLEWLARLLIEPRRLWRRYLLGNPLFVWRVLRQRIQQGRR